MAGAAPLLLLLAPQWDQLQGRVAAHAQAAGVAEVGEEQLGLGEAGQREGARLVGEPPLPAGQQEAQPACR